jgi:hypothetical protein
VHGGGVSGNYFLHYLSVVFGDSAESGKVR